MSTILVNNVEVTTDGSEFETLDTITEEMVRNYIRNTFSQFKSNKPNFEYTSQDIARHLQSVLGRCITNLDVKVCMALEGIQHDTTARGLKSNYYLSKEAFEFINKR